MKRIGLVVLAITLLNWYPAFGRGLFLFDGKSVRSGSGIVAPQGLRLAESVDQADGKIPIVTSSWKNDGILVFTVPTSGMTIKVNQGTVALYKFQFSAGAGYSWIAYGSDVLSDGAYGMILDSDWGMIDYSLSGMVDSPAHCLFTFCEVSQPELIGLSLGNLKTEQLPIDPTALFNFGYVPYLTDISVSRIASIDGTMCHEIDGSYSLNHVLAIILSDGRGILATVLTLEQALADQTPVMPSQLFGLVITKTPLNVDY